MKIRKATVRDAKKCLDLHDSQEKKKYWKREDFVESVKDSDVVFHVAEKDGKVIGYSSGFIVPTRRIEALMHETRVDLDHRGGKIGTMLVDSVTNELHKKGVKIIYALIEPKLKKFYVDSCKFKKSAKWLEVSKKK